MIRTIKFRGLRTDGKGFVYGLPFYSHGTGCWKITASNGWVPSYSNPDEGESTEFYDVDANTISEFTGLHDKNGNEIYEGDIIEYCNGTKANIIFKEGGFCGYDGYATSDDEAYTKLKSEENPIIGVEFEIEIIGNIHENK